MRQKLTPAFVKDAALPTKGDRVVYWDTAMPSFGLMATKNGVRSFVFQYRNALHQSRRTTWAVRLDGSSTGLTLDQAHRETKKVAGDVEKGLDPLERTREERRKAEEERRKAEAAVTTTLKAICEDWFTREGGMTRDTDGKASFAEKRKLRSAPERLAVFERHIYSNETAGARIEQIKRSEIVSLLDKIEDDNGPQAAHQVLAFLSRVFSWYAARNDDFRSPIIRGMGRVKPRQRAGKRTLADEEIRDLWTALDVGAENLPSCYPAYIRALLLTALRRTEAARGSWPEIATVKGYNIDGFTGNVWTIPATRMKNKLDHSVPLTAAVLALIGERPKDAKARPFLFSTVGGTKPFSGYSKAKKALDKEIAAIRQKGGRDAMPPWKLHDLRRTATHVIPGVEGVYDCYEYLREKADALTHLATLINRIIHRPADNVASLDEHRVKGAA